MIKRPNDLASESKAWEKAKADRNALVDISGEIKHETEKAYRFFDGKTTVWIPKSQCEWDEPSKTLVLPMWLAKAKELI